MFTSEEYIDLWLEIKTRTAKEIKWKLIKEVPILNPSLLEEEYMFEDDDEIKLSKTVVFES